MSKWIAEFELEDGDTMPEHMDLEYKGINIDFHCRPLSSSEIPNKSEIPTGSANMNDLGVDCVSRSTVLTLINDVKNANGFSEYSEYEYLFDQVDTMPSVTPIRPKGRWINKYHANEDGLDESCSAECSSCHKRSKGYAREDGYGLKFMYYDFCPKCGSDNREVKNDKRRIRKSNTAF